MVLVSKKKLMLLFKEIKAIKRAIKSQKKLFSSELESIKYVINKSNK
jgi:hypothetical protein